MKTILITGSTGNLGQAVVKKFIEEGHRVIGTVTHQKENKREFPGDRFEEVMVDVSDEIAAGSFVDEMIKKYGTIDAAVLTVGGFAEGTIAATSTSEVRNQYKTNFETAYNVAQPLFNQMIKQQEGRIFLIGSRPGLEAKSSKGMIGYGLSKSLLFRLAELMNDEGGKHGVVTSVLVPSTIDTAVNRKFMPEADFDSWVKPEAIADVIFFYCTDVSAAIRESVIKVYNKS